MTVMEMICASPCITSMICFSMEVKYGNMFNAQMHMQRHRVGARGNATTFPLPWQSVLAELQRLDEESAEGVSPSLPRTGEDLKYVVQVLLKTSDEDKRDNLKQFVHQAHVNRAKVVRCILQMKARGHRAYANVIAEDVAARARLLPENGVPPELLHLLPNDNTLDKIQVQKAATPVEALRSDLAQASQAFKEQRPNAVVLEQSSNEGADINDRRINTLITLTERLGRVPTSTVAEVKTSVGRRSHGKRARDGTVGGASLNHAQCVKCLALCTPFLSKRDLRNFHCASVASGSCLSFEDGDTQTESAARARLEHFGDAGSARLHRFIMSTGNAMENQFEPWYFGVAFAFAFKFCTGMPDMPSWSKHPRHRRQGDAPQVDFAVWVKLMTRRVEQQLRRDWLLGFSMGNVLFRSMVNLCRSVCSYDRIKREDGSYGFSAAELEEGAVSICKALAGNYKDLNGKVQKVNGDMTKVKWATNLNDAGKRILQNLEHTSRQIPGTMEVRKIMRFDTHAGRVRRGGPIFITWSPDEKQCPHVALVPVARKRSREHSGQCQREVR